MDDVLSQFDADAGPSSPQSSGKYGTPSNILDGLRKTESSGNQYAINSQSKAMGQYQFTPETVASLHQQGVKFDPFDPAQSRDAADQYLSKLAKQNGGDYNKALAQYGGFKTKDPSAYIAKVTGKPAPSAEPSADAADALLKQFDSDGATPQKPTPSNLTIRIPGQAPVNSPTGDAGGQGATSESASAEKPGAVMSAAAGAGKMFGSSALALQQIAGYGLGKLGSVTGSDDIKKAGDWLYSDATTGAQKLEQQNAPYAEAHPVANVAGQVAGFAGGMLTGAGDVLPFAGAGPASGVASAAMRGAAQGTVLNTLTSPATDPNDAFLLQKGKQALLGAVGGGAGGVLGHGLSIALNAGVGAVRGIITRMTSGSPAAAADQAVTHALESAGVKSSQIPTDLYTGLKSLAQKSIESGSPVDPQALSRLAKAQTLPVPVNPMRFQLTRNAMDFAVGSNLRGITGVGEPITQRMTEQNGAFIANFDAMGAKRGEDIVTAARPVISTLTDADKSAQMGVKTAYDAFKGATGKEMQVPLQGLAQDYAEIVGRFGKAGSSGGVIPGGVSGSFDALGLTTGTQQKVFSIENAEGLIKTINQNYDPSNKPQALALDQLRRAVQKSITDGAGSDVEGAAASQLAQKARGAAAARFQALDANPALRAAVSGVEPDKFINRFVLQGNQADIEQMMKTLQTQNPAQASALQDSLMLHLKGTATGFRPADKAIVSEDALNKMVNNPNSAARLEAVLGANKFGQLKQLADVVGDMKYAPVAAAVNTSNTASAGANLVKSTVQGGAANATLKALMMVPGLSGAAREGQQALQSSRARDLVNKTLTPSVGAAAQPVRLPDLMNLGAQTGAIAAGQLRKRPQQ